MSILTRRIPGHAARWRGDRSHRIVSWDDLPDEIGVIEIDPFIDDRDGDTRAAALDLPRFESSDVGSWGSSVLAVVFQIPLAGEEGITRSNVVFEAANEIRLSEANSFDRAQIFRHLERVQGGAFDLQEPSGVEAREGALDREAPSFENAGKRGFGISVFQNDPDLRPWNQQSVGGSGREARELDGVRALKACDHLELLEIAQRTL